MARVTTGGRRGAIDPLKHSQPLGGALVFLGLNRAMPLLHGSQGCTAFAKALLTRHFGEPIPLQTTAVTEVTAVFGGGEALVAGLDTIRAKQRPDVIGVLTTGLTEVSGEDVLGELRKYLDGAGPDAPLIVGVSTPDFRGGLSDGWSAALEALVQAIPLDPLDPARRAAGDAAGGAAGERRSEPEPLAVLAGPALTAADLDELADLVRGFGLAPVPVPDLSGSLDGHLAAEWSPLTTGGTTLGDLRRLGEAGAVLVAGATAAPAGDALAARTGARVLRHPHLCGLARMDALVAELMEHTGAPAPAQARRWRSRLADGLLDTHFVLGGVRVAIAGEPEQLVATGSLLRDAGAEIVAAVSPTPAPVLAEAPWDEIVVGDLADLDERAAEAGAELIVASSHGRAIADRLGAAHLCLGFPVYDRLGPQLRGTAGYRGSLHLLLDAANLLLDHRDRRGHHTPAFPPIGAVPLGDTTSPAN
ncbi:nitrogenase iron-molybdenum cofactor biosynthesis protein NifN [Thermopolyspora sp. NPDC052614]|uniref:nitrogenase iron-molybdenum cofactor biosynthesis protein NifN n=1 Tax=Thermopolyspora sp. NPDC052614 TaxID=3155682 RepID=UPI003442BFBA